MSKKFSLKLLSLAVATTLTLTACGGGGSSKSNNPSNNNQQQPTMATGKFLDSAVEGLEVWQNSKSLGKTNANGEYTYVVGGGAVTFKLGSLTLGSTMPKTIVTPADLTTDSQQLVRTLQILQSADKDNNPANGITIDNTVAERFTASDFNDLLKEEDDDTFTAKLEPKLNNGQKIVSYDEAINHFKETSTTQLAQSPELVNKAKDLVGYWVEQCQEIDRARMVFKVEAQGNKLQVVDSKEYLYDNEQCSGSPISSKQNNSNKSALIFTGTGNIESIDVIQALNIDRHGNSTPVFVHSGNNFINFQDVYLQRVKSLDDLTPVVNDNPADVKKIVDTLQGYWQSQCETLSTGNKINENHQSKQDFTFITKASDNSMTLEKSVDVFFTDSNCQSADMVVADTRQESYTLSDPQTINGITSVSVTSRERVTLVNNNKFIVGDEIEQRTSQATFDNWFNKANFVKDNNKTEPEIIDKIFTPAQGGNLAKLTVKFNTNMNFSYGTHGAYNPAKQYWVDMKTFVTEFNSYEPKGIIHFDHFRNSGGVNMTTTDSYTFPDK